MAANLWNCRKHESGRRNAAGILILFHPDCNRRLWLLTKSADLSEKQKALAGSPAHGRNTAGGDFHPALRTSSGKYRENNPGTGLVVFWRIRGTGLNREIFRLLSVEAGILPVGALVCAKILGKGTVWA